MWKKSNGLYFDTRLKKISFIKHFVTTKELGDMKNEKNLSKIPCCQAKIVTAQQIHSNNIHIVQDSDRGNVIPKVDGLITNLKNLPLGIFTADCAPVFISDISKNIIGVIHSGRKGIEKRIIKKAIGILVRQYKSIPKDILISIGPHIGQCCYEIDLSKRLKEDILSCGIPVENISECKICTKHSPEFYSYRRNKTDERMISVIYIKDNLGYLVD